ncbi:MAG TPA: SDR family NAD(P)-dependent oxidoreductase [Gaiellaceae bacterium]|jgi:2-hydroxycyclohexanecarboxyl-CoA dehydrogenase
MDSSFSLEGKRILVTGAASGMGRAFAVLAAADGAALGLLDVNAEGLAETRGLLDGGARSESFPTDLSEWGQVEAAVKGTVDALGGLDVAVNVAGWDQPGRFWEQPLELWQRLIAVNLWSVLHVCRAVVPLFLEQEHGRIVMTASDAGRVGSKGETVYATAKGGIMALTKSLAREVAPHVTVNCLCPGPTRTPLYEQEAVDNPKLMERLERAIPLRRIAEPEDQARALAFLASDASAYMTGQVLSVSGGLTMVG